MRRSLVQTYMTVGAIFGVILAGPLWYSALFGRALPTAMPAVQSLLAVLLAATVRGVLRAFAWLPSLIYNVGMHRMAFETWLFHGWW